MFGVRVQLIVHVLLAGWLSASASAALVTNATTWWTPITYPNGNYPDFFNDEQATSDEQDLVGNTANPSFYMAFEGAGTTSLTDGSLAFRARVAGQVNPPGFDRTLFVGIDADLDGAIELYLAVANSGSNDHLEIFGPGTDTNTSPNTTSITPYSPALTYTESASNYAWVPVTATLDPTATTFDVDNGANTDYFISFSIPFADIVSCLAAQGLSVTQNTAMAYIVATATQDNALNQDLNGPGRLYDGDSTWDDLGMISDPFAPGELLPEPGSATLLLAAAALAVGRRRRRRHGRRAR